MKVLWFTDYLMPAACRHVGRPVTDGGFWVSALLDSIAGRPDVRLGVVTAGADLPDTHFQDGGTDYFLVRQSWSRHLAKLIRNPRACIAKCARIARDWGPDLVHVHGTEFFYGLLLAWGLLDVPSIVSVQGLLGPYSRRFFGSLSWRDVLRSQRLSETIRGSGVVWDHYRVRRNARREAAILAAAGAFAGRTQWDRAHLKTVNPSARYHEVGEILRPAFYEAAWDLTRCRRHTVIFTNVGNPNRGAEDLLQAVANLRGDFPDVRVRLAGKLYPRRGYHRFLMRRVRELGLSDRVEYLGFLNAGALAGALVDSHVFVHPSHLENSPNTLCEAMMVGMPCVASFAGGMPSLVADGQTGLLFPPGDSALLAERIGALLADDPLSARLGAAARSVALERHRPGHVVGQLLDAYRAVVEAEAVPVARATRVSAVGVRAAGIA